MTQATHVTQVQLFLFQEATAQYQEYGTVGCAIMGTPGTYATFKLGCYNDQGEYLCTCPIGASNDSSIQFTLQGSGYANVRDDQGRLWSILFPSEAEAVNFGAHVSVAMFGASNQPTANILTCDVAQGKKDKCVFAGDKVKVRYTSWVVQRGSATELPRLGSKLESNEGEEKPHMYAVPPNHNSVSNDMKGFEGMTVGMAEESQRFIIVPSASKKGQSPPVDMCFLIHVIKKKDESKGPASPQGGFGSPQGAPQQGGTPQAGYPGAPGQWPQPAPGAPYGAPGYGAPPPHGYPPQPHFDPMNPYGAAPGMGYGSGALVIPGQQAPGAPAPYTGALVVQPQVDLPPPPQPAPVPAPPPPPAGFSSEQLDTIERMRDQMTKLQLQLKETQNKVDMFAHDYRQHDQKTKPMSLSSAQLEHSIKTLLQETETMKEDLVKRDETLKLMEDKNKQLQNKVDKFSVTATQLAEEKKSAINNSNETKIEADRQLLSLQTQLTRIQSEREDVTRHLSTVKRLLEVSDQDLNAEKGKVQVADVTHSTVETKIANLNEQLNDERSRRKILEGKIVTLAEELRTSLEEVRAKESDIEDKRRKIEANRLHWSQMMEDERNQAATELREIRQELVEELALRDARYSSERQRVSQESFDRGKVAGVDEGYQDALLDADSKVQSLSLEAQRSRSEVETMRIKLRQITEFAESDKRRLEAQINALTRTVDDLTGQNSAAEIELDSLERSLQSAKDSAFERLVGMVKGLSRDVSKTDTLGLLHLLRVNRPLDYTFELKREEEEGMREDLEREEVLDWVRQAIHSDAPVGAPPKMRTKAGEERAVPAPGVIESQSLKEEEEIMPSLVAVAGTGANIEPSEELEAIQRRYDQIIKELSERDPTLGLVPPRPPTPPPPPPPPPPAPPVVVQPVVQQPPASRATASDTEPEPLSRESDGEREPFASPATPAALPVGEPVDPRPLPPAVSSTTAAAGRPPAVESDSESEIPLPAPVEQKREPLAETKPAHDDDDDEQEEAARAPAPAPPSRPAPIPDSDEEEAPKPAAKPKVSAKKAMSAAPKKAMFEETDDEESQQSFMAAKPVAKVEPPAPAPAKKVAQPTKKAFAETDEESDAAPAPTRAPAKVSSPTGKTSAAPATKRAAPTSSLFGASSSDEEEEKPVMAAAKKAMAKSAPASKPAKKPSTFSDDDDAAPAPKPVAKVTSKKSMPAVKAKAAAKSSLFDDSDDD